MDRQTPAEMYKRRVAGESLEAIGRDNGLTRERIRQLVQGYEQQTGAEPARAIVRAQEQAFLEQCRQDEEEKLRFAEMSGEQQNKYVHDLRAQGLTLKLIGARCGISGTAVWAKLNAPGKARRYRNVSPILVQKWLVLYKAGATQEQIAKQTGYSQAVVSNYLKRLVVTRRRWA